MVGCCRLSAASSRHLSRPRTSTSRMSGWLAFGSISVLRSASQVTVEMRPDARASSSSRESRVTENCENCCHVIPLLTDERMMLIWNDAVVREGR